MYAQAAIKRNIIPRNGAYHIVNKDAHFCAPSRLSLRSKNYTSLGRITLDTATEPVGVGKNSDVCRLYFCANFVEGRVGLMIEYICIFCKKLSVVKFMTITFKYIFWDSLDAML